MVRSSDIKKRGYISKFLKRANKALDGGLKEADKAVASGIKKADEVLDYGIEYGLITAKQAQIETKKLRQQAQKEEQQLRKKAQKEAMKLRKQATKEGKRIRREGKKKIQDGVSLAKKISSNRSENLRMLEKLGRLKKAGIITNKEFQQKKKELLKRI